MAIIPNEYWRHPQSDGKYYQSDAPWILFGGQWLLVYDTDGTRPNDYPINVPKRLYALISEHSVIPNSFTQYPELNGTFSKATEPSEIYGGKWKLVEETTGIMPKGRLPRIPVKIYERVKEANNESN